jgi:hypothetical protein
MQPCLQQTPIHPHPYPTPKTSHPARKLHTRNFELEMADGKLLAGRRALYHSTQPLAYGAHPCENVVYNGGRMGYLSYSRKE